MEALPVHRAIQILSGGVNPGWPTDWARSRMPVDTLE
jgi:hypothetical protein